MVYMPYVRDEVTRAGTCTRHLSVATLPKLHAAEGAGCTHLHKVWGKGRAFKTGQHQTESTMLIMPQ
eukprot:3054583-Amphidinium_carterae.1